MKKDKLGVATVTTGMNPLTNNGACSWVKEITNKTTVEFKVKVPVVDGAEIKVFESSNGIEVSNVSNGSMLLIAHPINPNYLKYSTDINDGILIITALEIKTKIKTNGE